MSNRILSIWNWCKIVLQKLGLNYVSQNCNNTYVVRSFFYWLWNCRIFKFHKWTSNAEKGIKPTKEQLEKGIEGFNDYAKVYCEICGTESKLSKKLRCKYKN
jgi:hypothetical protein